MVFRFFRKKKKGEYVDLVRLQKRGIIEDEGEDRIAITDNVTESAGETSETGSNLGFLGSLAGASSESTDETESGESESSYSASSYDKDETEELTRKINDIAERLDLIERKIERIEGRLGLGVSSY